MREDVKEIANGWAELRCVASVVNRSGLDWRDPGAHRGARGLVVNRSGLGPPPGYRMRNSVADGKGDSTKAWGHFLAAVNNATCS